MVNLNLINKILPSSPLRPRRHHYHDRHDHYDHDHHDLPLKKKLVLNQIFICKSYKIKKVNFCA